RPTARDPPRSRRPARRPGPKGPGIASPRGVSVPPRSLLVVRRSFRIRDHVHRAVRLLDRDSPATFQTTVRQSGRGALEDLVTPRRPVDPQGFLDRLRGTERDNRAVGLPDVVVLGHSRGPPMPRDRWRTP